MEKHFKNGRLIDLGVKAGMVEKSGAWFSYDSQRIGQGENKTVSSGELHLSDEIELGIRSNAGLIAEAALMGDSLGSNKPSAEETDAV